MSRKLVDGDRGVNFMCAMVKVVALAIGDGRPGPTFNDRNPYIYNVYINPYYWVDDHPLLYGNNRSLDPGTSDGKVVVLMFMSFPQ